MLIHPKKQANPEHSTYMILISSVNLIAKLSCVTSVQRSLLSALLDHHHTPLGPHDRASRFEM